MFVILLGLCAVASAAPQYSHFGHPPPPPRFNHGFRREHFHDEIFDTGRFWLDISTELRQLDDMLAEFSSHFPSRTSQAGVVGKEYKITIPLTGFEEKDIVIKAREGLLMVQAVHKYDEGSEKSYLDVRVLPTFVNVTGRWIYADNLLTITFPLKDSATVTGVSTEDPTSAIQTEATDAHVTEAPKEQSREDIEVEADHNNQDADVGASRGDLNENQDKEMLTNEISESDVEATTYSIDLKDEIEFVPVRYH